jgi:hypothetical protein
MVDCEKPIAIFSAAATDVLQSAVAAMIRAHPHSRAVSVGDATNDLLFFNMLTVSSIQLLPF